MSGKKIILLLISAFGTLTFLGCGSSSSTASSTAGDTSEITYTIPAQSTYSIVDTGQTKSYNATVEITAPSAGEIFYGQDAQFLGVQPSYTKSSDGLTVKDNVTGLTWQQNHYTGQVYWTEAQAVPTALNAANYGGYNDWRLPTIKELYSIWNGGSGWPYIDANYFTINYTSEMELSHAIFWSS
ncbi:MAG: DUF1566 domain-containing protein, partial [Syntrophales bacterium]